MKFKYTLWTEVEEQFIIDNFGEMTYKQMAENLGKTLGQVNSKIQHLKRKGLIIRKATRKVMAKAEKELEEWGLDLSLVKLELGKEYEVFLPKQENAKLDDYFRGIFIQNTPRHVTLKNKLGYCQSFLKADILMKIIKVKEVN